ncbi:hypothetical protein AB0D38_45035, partial [Streptomyces sp. NPDC048279]|uniref:hypothetical protein n=1 Tax=Streptomyces sp. NPDC048279 TaxID=3154714 RepID=UPI003423007D
MLSCHGLFAALTFGLPDARGEGAFRHGRTRAAPPVPAEQDQPRIAHRHGGSGVAWQAVGVMFGAYEIALQYAKER